MLLTFISGLLLSAFFSASETAFVACSKQNIYKNRRNLGKKANILLKLLDNKAQLVSTALFFNTIVNVLISSTTTMFVSSMMNAHQYGIVIVLISTLLVAFVVLVFGEMMPKAIALDHAERISLMSARIFHVLMIFSGPLMDWMHALINKVCMLWKLRIPHQISTTEKLREAIMYYGKDTKYINMLGGVLDLVDTTVEEIMTHRKDLMCIDINDTKEEILHHIETSPYSRLPVCDDSRDNIIGVLHIRDFLTAAIKSKDAEAVDIKAIMHKALFTPYSTTLRSQLYTFMKQYNHIAFVTDEYGSLIGLVTLEDIIEEITGDIHDEHDVHNVEIVKELDGSMTIDGDVAVRTFNKWFPEQQLDNDEDAVTIAGLIMNHIQRIPAINESIEICNYRMVIKDVRQNEIFSIKIYPLSQSELHNSN